MCVFKSEVNVTLRMHVRLDSVFFYLIKLNLWALSLKLKKRKRIFKNLFGRSWIQEKSQVNFKTIQNEFVLECIFWIGIYVMKNSFITKQFSIFFDGLNPISLSEKKVNIIEINKALNLNWLETFLESLQIIHVNDMLSI